MIPPPNLFHNEFGLGIIYSFTIIICSLMVYFGTKEIYELSSYKGLKYFRLSFLFFAIAYLCKSFISFLLFFLGISRVIDMSPMIFGAFALFMFMYFSSMAVFYLLYSVMWKRWKSHPNVIYVFHLIAFLLSAGSILLRGRGALLGLNVCLLLFVVLSVFIAYKDSKSRKAKHNLYPVYVLLLVFWILNIVDVLIPRFLTFFQMIVELASIFMFLLILYKVLRKTGPE
ncbi:MAG: hypothetical protein WC852_05670 [Candidatus Nanoarchaeia archaeon]|jgi:hypothetical protein